jgi:1A family penicillin-binding protein
MRRLRDRLHELTAEWRTGVARHPRAMGAAVGIFALLAVGSIVGLLLFYNSLRRGLPGEDAVRHISEMSESTAVYDAGDRLVFTIYQEQRIEVPLDQISPHLLHAIVAIEDQRFYDHRGFDAVRIASAALANLRHLRAVQGGSTITQQLARQSFLTPDKTVRRKLQELILAAQIEQLFTKTQILEMYLNKVYFGDGLYGIEAASRGYFGKHASELSIPEAALLAGLAKSPSSYAPTVSLSRAIARRNVVLQAMLEEGMIDRAAWQEARHSHVTLHDDLRSDEPHGQYFKEQVRRELVDRFGWQRVYQGGLRVFSTIDMSMQVAAEKAVADSLKTLDEKRRALAVKRLAARKARGLPDPKEPAAPEPLLQSALIALDPQSGHVRAMVGGRNFDDSRFNRAVQAKRQPGSAFKPFVYAAALEAGYTPATVLDHLDEPIATFQGAWTPEDGHSSATSLSMRTALRMSSNRAAVRLLQEIGIPRTIEYARALGVGDVPTVPSLALGSGEVTVQSITAAYAAFANHGLVPRPTIVRRVEDRDGRLLYESNDPPVRAISDVTAFLMTSMLADVVNAGTGSRARRLGFTLPAAGKTGTTNDFNDAWFIGFTPKLVAGVWVGFDQPRTILPNGFAADIAVPVWADFMKAATRRDSPDWFTPPPGVTTATVCRLSGKLASEGCEDVEVIDADGHIERRSMIYTEYFARGTQPTTYCDLHPTRGLLGKIAGLLGAGDHPLPPHIDDIGLRPGGAATTGAAVEPAPGAATAVAVEPAAHDEPKKKRGFWARLFGVGKDEKDKDAEPQSTETVGQPKKRPGQ